MFNFGIVDYVEKPHYFVVWLRVQDGACARILWKKTGLLK